MSDLNTLFEQFLRERVYLHNITPATRSYYLTAWRSFGRSQATAPPRAPDVPVLTCADLQHFVVHLRERGVKPVTCNCWLRGLNAFARWLLIEGKIPESVRVPSQKEEKRLLPLLDDTALRLLIGYHPKSFVQWRVYSVGRWEGDILVVETIGFNANTWLDAFGHPRTEASRVTERFRRTSFGKTEVDVTLEDPEAYTRPFSFRYTQMLTPDTHVLESVCENEKDRALLDAR